jgi:hypothetical protein
MTRCITEWIADEALEDEALIAEIGIACLEQTLRHDRLSPSALRVPRGCG